jgi:hypothetical protein
MREQRKYQRARIQPALAEAVTALGASVIWPNLETSYVLDLSYKGAAARRPGLFPVAVQTRAAVELKLGWLEPFRVQTRIVWCTLDGLGMEFIEIPPEGHRAMSEFLDATLIGFLLRPVERALFSRGQNFTHWFQGPAGIHVFVWLNSTRLVDRVNVDLDGNTVQFERGRGGSGPLNERRKALLILSQMDKPGLPMEEFLRTLGASSETI